MFEIFWCQARATLGERSVEGSRTVKVRPPGSEDLMATRSETPTTPHDRVTRQWKAIA